MTMKELSNKWTNFVNRMNRLGIPVPTVRDPKTGKGSITTTLVVCSAGLFGICILFMLGSAIAKLAGFFALTDVTTAQVKTAADYSFQFLLAAIGAYLGRFMQQGPTSDSTDLPLPQKPSKAPVVQPKADDPDQQ